MAKPRVHKSVFRVIDAYDHPHGGRILRLRLHSGDSPTLRDLKKRKMMAYRGDSDPVQIKIAAFALCGGKPSNPRLARTGRADVHVDGDEAQAVEAGWELAGPV